MSGTGVRIREVVAMSMIGDGVLGAWQPARHAARWQVGPTSWQRLMHVFVRRPWLTRLLAAAETGGGLWYACRLPVRRR